VRPRRIENHELFRVAHVYRPEQSRGQQPVFPRRSALRQNRRRPIDVPARADPDRARLRPGGPPRCRHQHRAARLAPRGIQNRRSRARVDHQPSPVRLDRRTAVDPIQRNPVRAWRLVRPEHDLPAAKVEQVVEPPQELLAQHSLNIPGDPANPFQTAVQEFLVRSSRRANPHLANPPARDDRLARRRGQNRSKRAPQTQPLGNGSAARALTQDGSENFQPAWSPDGQSIAYVSRKRRGIWVIPVTRGVARRVTDHGDSPAWSPDGKFLAFRDGALEMNPGLETSQTPGVTVWVVGADGSGAHPLTNPSQPPGAHNYPRWTPDGRYVLFAEMLAPPFNQPDLIRRAKNHFSAFVSLPWLVDPVSRRLQPIDIDTTVVRSPAISPDGRRLYYVGSGSGQQPGVWQARLSGCRALSPEPLVPGAGLIARDVFLSPDGTHIAFGQQSGPIRTLNTGFAQSMGNDWSPDSTRIAFAGLDDGVWNIYWVAVSTGAVRQLTHFTSRSAFVRYTAWSPQGDRIVFEHNTIASSIYIADLK